MLLQALFAQAALQHQIDVTVELATQLSSSNAALSKRQAALDATFEALQHLRASSLPISSTDILVRGLLWPTSSRCCFGVLMPLPDVHARACVYVCMYVCMCVCLQRIVDVVRPAVSLDVIDKHTSSMQHRQGGGNNSVEYDDVSVLNAELKDLQEQVNAAEKEVGLRGEHIDMLTDRVAGLETCLGSSQSSCSLLSQRPTLHRVTAGPSWL